MSENDEDAKIVTLSDVEKANAVTSKGVVSDLLGPAAKVFGKKLGEWAEESTRQKNANISSHIEAVKNRNPELVLEANPKNESAFREWVDEAAKYSAEDEEAALWRGILEKIMNDDSAIETELIETAKRLNGDDIRVMQSVSEKNESIEGNISTEKLLKIGVVDTVYKLHPYFYILLIFAINLYLFNYLYPGRILSSFEFIVASITAGKLDVEAILYLFLFFCITAFTYILAISYIRYRFVSYFSKRDNLIEKIIRRYIIHRRLRLTATGAALFERVRMYKEERG